jgi:hypothetical protein
VCVCVCGNKSQHVDSEGHMEMRVVMHQSNTPCEHALTVPVHSSVMILIGRVFKDKVLKVVDWVG